MIGLLNGSPKAPGGTSSAILERFGILLGDTALLSAKEQSEGNYAQLNACEAVVIAFPIYADALPSHLLRFLMCWEEYRKANGGSDMKVYAVSHAGFYEGLQCRWSLDILRNFCARAGLSWCGGAGLGGGVIFSEMQKSGVVKPLSDAIDLVAQTAKEGKTLTENRFVNVGMPRWMYKAAGNMGWNSGAKQNGLKPKDLYRTE